MAKNVALLDITGDNLTDEEHARIQAELCEPVEVEEVEELHIALDDAEEITDAVDEATDTVETLDNIREVVETAPEEQLDKVAMEMLKITYRDLCTRVGFTKSSMALEGYTETMTKSVALESIGETIKQILTTIMNVIMKAVEWVKNFFKQFFDKKLLIEKRAEKLKAAADAMKNKGIESTDVLEQGAYSNYLRYKNNLIQGEDLPRGLEAFFKALDKVQKEYLNDTKFSRVEELVKNTIDTAEAADQGVPYVMYKKLLGELPVFREKADAHHQSALRPNRVIGEEELPLGDKSMYSSSAPIFQSSANEDMTGNLHLKFWIENSSSFKEIPKDQKHNPLTVSEVGETCTSILKHLNTYKENETLAAKFNDLLKSVRTLLKEKFATDAANTSRRHFFFLNTLIRSAVDVFVMFSAQLKTYDLSVCGAVLQFGQASLKLAK